MELNKITQRLIKSLKHQGIEVFEYDTAYPPDIMPPTVRDCNPLIYKHKERWYCTYIPENQRVIVSTGTTMQEAMRQFDAKYWEAVESRPDYLEIDRVYNMLKFEEVRHIFYKLVARLPDSDFVTLGTIASWGDTNDGQETLDFLEPYLKGEKGYKVITARDDIEEITQRIKSGEPLHPHDTNEGTESDLDKEDFNGKGIESDESNKEHSYANEESLRETEEEQITPEVISTLLTEAHYLISYTESCYIQATDAYDINTIEEIRNVGAQIALLKVKLESQLNKTDKL